MKRFSKELVLKEIAREWLHGRSFFELFEVAQKEECKLGIGRGGRHVKVENVVNIFENGIAFDGSLLIGAVYEFIKFMSSECNADMRSKWNFIQKQFKYGLPSKQAIIVYEMGFADRVIAQDLVMSLNISSSNKTNVIEEIRKNEKVALATIEKYPLYFNSILQRMLL